MYNRSVRLCDKGGGGLDPPWVRNICSTPLLQQPRLALYKSQMQYLWSIYLFSRPNLWPVQYGYNVGIGVSILHVSDKVAAMPAVEIKIPARGNHCEDLHNRKVQRILVTIHGTTDAMYTTIQSLQKRYRPIGEITEEIQSRFIISFNIHHIHQHHH